MSQRANTTCALLAALSLLATGCHPDPQPQLPTVSATSPADAVRTLADRAGRVRTVAGTGTFELADADGRQSQYAVTIAVRLPNQARLIATAAGGPAFDLTVRPDGVWLLAPGGRGTGRPSAGAVAGADAAALAKSLASLLSRDFFADPAVVATDAGDELVLTRGGPNEAAVVCHVDRRTLAPRRYELLDAVGAERFSLGVDDYHATADGAVWPWRATSVSSAGRIVLTLSAATVNGDLPADATTPPAGADRLP